MTAPEVRHAADIHAQLKTLRHSATSSRSWQTQGRFVMGQTVPVKDSARAIATALAGLNQAIGATCWVEMLDTVDGEYPVPKN